jgi:hypothetical protein
MHSVAVFSAACAAGPTPPSSQALTRNVAAVVGEHSRGIDEIVDASCGDSRFRATVGAAALCVKDAIGCGKGARDGLPRRRGARTAVVPARATDVGVPLRVHEKLGTVGREPGSSSESAMNAASGTS